MASALEQLTNNYETNQAVSFYDFYNAYGRDHDKVGWPDNGIDPYSLRGKWQNFWTGMTTSAEKEYQNYLAEYEYRKNAKATAAANKETYAREDNQIQRLMQDYSRAGLNPYMILSGGNLSSGVVSSQAQRPDYRRSSKESRERSKNGSILGTALKLLAILALKG